MLTHLNCNKKGALTRRGWVVLKVHVCVRVWAKQFMLVVQNVKHVNQKSFACRSLRTIGRMNWLCCASLRAFRTLRACRLLKCICTSCNDYATSCGSSTSTSIAWQFWCDASLAALMAATRFASKFRLNFWFDIGKLFHELRHTLSFDISSMNSRRKLSFDFAETLYYNMHISSPFPNCFYFAYALPCGFIISTPFTLSLSLCFSLTVFYCYTQPLQILTFLCMTEHIKKIFASSVSVQKSTNTICLCLRRANTPNMSAYLWWLMDYPSLSLPLPYIQYCQRTCRR